MATLNSANGSYQSGNKTLFEVQMLATPNGSVVSNTNPLPVTLGSNTITISGNVNVTTIANTNIYNSNSVAIEVATALPVSVNNFPTSFNVYSTPGGMGADAFGRARVSNPLTLFDSSHRYRDNNLWATSNTAGGTYAFSTNEGLVNLNVNTSNNAEVVRETTKVFSYQPGKSLQVMTTFVLNAAKTNLRQRVGYYGAQNGFYLELDGSTLSFVQRTYVTGSVVETRIDQSSWNINSLPSLDIVKAQILWMDFEWLGVGAVRMGFVIDGEFIHCHTFYHANLITTTYMTTASLPMRYEIKNTGITTGSSTLKQICSTVISEGGYELRGLQQAIGTAIGAPRDLTTVNTYYPVISLRLKSSPDRLDAIVILTALSLMGITNNANYNWRAVATGTTTGGSWVSAGTDSAVEYNITGTSFAGGRVLASGWTNGSNQGATPVDVLKQALFSFQLERNGLTSTPYELTLIVAADSAGADIYASMDWEEISR